MPTFVKSAAEILRPYRDALDPNSGAQPVDKGDLRALLLQIETYIAQLLLAAGFDPNAGDTIAAAVIAEIRGDVAPERDTLAKISLVLDGFATAASILSTIRGAVPENRNTLKKLSDVFDALAGDVADKIDSSPNLEALSGLVLAPNRLLHTNIDGALALASLTAAGRALLDDATALAQRTTLELEKVDNTPDLDKPVSNPTAVRLARRALREAVAGKPLLSPDIAWELVNRTTGTRIAAIMATGEAIFGGRPVLLPMAAQVDPGGRVLSGVTQDGRLIQGPTEHRPHLGSLLRAEVDERGTILRAVGQDGRMIAGPLEHLASIDGRSGVELAGGAPVSLRDVFGVDAEAADYDAWISGGQAYLHVRGSIVQLTGAETWIKAEVRGGQLCLVRSDGRRITTPLAGRYPELPAGCDTVVYSDLYGQSNAAGNFAGGVVNGTAFRPRYLSFAAGQRTLGNYLGHTQERLQPQAYAYDPLHDFALGCEQEIATGGGAGETANSGFAIGILGRTDLAARAVLLTTCSAVGSADIDMLRSDAPDPTSDSNAARAPWLNLEHKLARAMLFWRLQGLRALAGPLRYNQGEGNIGRSKAIFLGNLQQMRDDWQALAARWAATWPASGYGGHAGKAPLVTTQTCSGAHYGFPKAEVPWAQLQINLDDPTTALCIGPTYDQAYAADGVHLLALGQEMQGARQAVAWNAWLRGESWRPLHVRKDAGFAPTRSGTTVTLRIYNHFGLPLVFDTTTVTGLGAAQGFAWADNGNGNAVTVTGAAIVDATTVQLTLSAVPTGTGGAIEIACNGTLGGSAGPASGNRATLRTNSTLFTTDGGRPVEHFICIDRVAVT